MKKVLKYLSVIVIFWTVSFSSCKKEYSCENCRSNQPPIAKAGRDTTIFFPKDSILLDGSASSDPDGFITSYKWVKISGAASAAIIKTDSSKTLVKTLVSGVYTFELTVTDNGGLSAKDTVQVIVNNPAANKPPVANAGRDQTITLPVDTTSLNGSLSFDPDGFIVSYQWTKIAGPSSFVILNNQSVQTKVNSLVKGVYQFELKVIDNSGLIGKDTIGINVDTAAVIPICENRKVINASLVEVGTLSVGRYLLVSATAGNKILFAGGSDAANNSSRVDIYDIVSKTWSTAELSIGDRRGMVAATVGNKILFAGGGDDNYGFVTSRVDIYDVSTNTWSVAQLSKARQYLAAATIGNKILFAGGGSFEPYFMGSSVVDIYDNTTNTWSTASLSEGRIFLTANAVGNKVYFAGGTVGPGASNVSTKIDIYDNSTNTWSTSNLQEAKSWMASIAVSNKIYWGSGINGFNSNITLSGKVEIRDINTGASSFSCMIPRYMLNAVIKDDNIVFFTGSGENPSALFTGNHFEIYNITTNTWSTALLSQVVFNPTIISVNNIIYVAGGSGDQFSGTIFNKVWRLDF